MVLEPRSCRKSSKIASPEGPPVLCLLSRLCFLVFRLPNPRCSLGPPHLCLCRPLFLAQLSLLFLYTPPVEWNSPSSSSNATHSLLLWNLWRYNCRDCVFICSWHLAWCLVPNTCLSSWKAPSLLVLPFRVCLWKPQTVTEFSKVWGKLFLPQSFIKKSLKWWQSLKF